MVGGRVVGGCVAGGSVAGGCVSGVWDAGGCVSGVWDAGGCVAGVELGGVTVVPGWEACVPAEGTLEEGVLLELVGSVGTHMS